MAANRVSRRTIIAAAGAGLGLAAGGCNVLRGKGGCGCGGRRCRRKAAMTFKNSSFYKNGKFDPEAGKDAYIAVMKYHRYPVFKGLREKLWVSDYGIGEFTRLGLGACIFINREEKERGDRYMLMDLYLLPNQMLPEHYHLATKKARPKLESWFVRHGMAYIIGEGDETPGIKKRMPESQRASATVFHATKAGPGDLVSLNRPTARHSQIAGPQGCIESEVANFHDNDGVRHTNPKLVFP